MHQAWEDSGGEKDRRGDDTADESGDGSPGERAERLDAGAFELAIEWVGLNEEAEPEFVEGGVGDTDNEAVEEGADQGTEDGGGVSGGPIESAAGDPREQGEMGEEPPENRVTHSPAHAGAVAADVTLEEEAEADADQDGDAEMDEDQGRTRRRGCAVAGEEWEVVA